MDYIVMIQPRGQTTWQALTGADLTTTQQQAAGVRNEDVTAGNRRLIWRDERPEVSTLCKILAEAGIPDRAYRVADAPYYYSAPALPQTKPDPDSWEANPLPAPEAKPDLAAARKETDKVLDAYESLFRGPSAAEVLRALRAEIRAGQDALAERLEAVEKVVPIGNAEGAIWIDLKDLRTRLGLVASASEVRLKKLEKTIEHLRNI